MSPTGEPHLTQVDLAAYLSAAGIPADILELKTPTPTVEAAAQAMDTTVDRIVKTLVFYVRDAPIAVLAAGTARVSALALARHFQVPADEVRLASPAEVAQETGYSVGAVPPFGHRRKLPTLVDRSLPEAGPVLAGGGSDHALLRVEAMVLIGALEGERVDLTSKAAGTSL